MKSKRTSDTPETAPTVIHQNGKYHGKEIDLKHLEQFVTFSEKYARMLQGGSSGKLIDTWQGKLKDEVDEANAILTNRKQIKKIWSQVDFNGNGYVSLAEIDKVDRRPSFLNLPP